MNEDRQPEFVRQGDGAYEVRVGGESVGAVEKRETPFRPGGGKRKTRPSGGKGWVVTRPAGMHRIRHDTRREAAEAAIRAAARESARGE